MVLGPKPGGSKQGRLIDAPEEGHRKLFEQRVSLAGCRLGLLLKSDAMGLALAFGITQETFHPLCPSSSSRSVNTAEVSRGVRRKIVSGGERR